MSYTGGWTAQSPFTRPVVPTILLDGVRTRRIMALAIDLAVICVMFLALFVVVGLLGFATFGLSWLLIPPLFPVIALFYNGLSVSGWRMATPGMRAMDLEMRTVQGGRVPMLLAAAHAVLYYLSWTLLTPFVLLVSLITRDKRCLHDIAAGVIVTRRVR